MTVELPTDRRDLALWLLDNLEGVRRVDQSTLWSGRLPEGFDFESVERHIELTADALRGASDAGNRVIEFHPSLVGVYEDLGEFLRDSANRVRVPERFVIRSLHFTYPAPEGTNTVPAPVDAYFGVTSLWAALSQLADVPVSTGRYALFVAGHDARLKLRPDYGPDHLVHCAPLTTFAAEFNANGIHADQKRSIVRSALIDTFKPHTDATLGDVLKQFPKIESEVRKSYAMYMAEFSVKKVMSEVERQNLDDTLSLNKTLSDIQNQLLALPAAILLAGASLKAEEPARNYAVLAGMIVFCMFLWTLVGNQRHSVNAIESHIGIRKKKVQAMPTDSGKEALSLFPGVEARVRRQRWTLRGISAVVWLMLIGCILAVLQVNHDIPITGWLRDAWNCLCLLKPGSQPQAGP